ncbi:hypothetical protein KIPB_000127 [Kipferlia bialata]|uniref:THH1/TOM1/TOM3 domain-containing protein n=1 Tax=Kipferlia bialata TaxID=797122 RepID=A0A9K3CM26_9EUKA|nr:hypothetical protein KIPB_000127 [Kipferlia bialata]|eukprot:g127.t1
MSLDRAADRNRASNSPLPGTPVGPRPTIFAHNLHSLFTTSVHLFYLLVAAPSPDEWNVPVRLATMSLCTLGVRIVLGSIPLCILFIQVFRGIVSPRAYHHVHHVSLLVSSLAALSVVCIASFDYTWCIHNGVDVDSATLFQHGWDVTCAYLSVYALQTLHLAVILVSMLCLRGVSSRRLKQRGCISGTCHSGHRHMDKLKVLPVIVVCQVVAVCTRWIESLAVDPSAPEASVTLLMWCLRVDTVLEVLGVVLIVYPTGIKGTVHRLTPPRCNVCQQSDTHLPPLVLPVCYVAGTPYEVGCTIYHARVIPVHALRAVG